MVIRRSPLLLSVLLVFAALSLAQGAPRKNGTITGTWFGSFIDKNPDGRVSHDTAVLVVRQAGSTFSGSLGPTIDQQTPWNDGSVKGNRLQFHLDADGGLNVTLALHPSSLTGSATGQRVNAQLDLKPAPGLLPHEQLVEEITKADRELFDAFDNCDVPRYGEFLSKHLEFYQDHTGKTGYQENLQALQNRCAEGIHLRRELEPGSLIVNAVPGCGAIQAGIQRFYSRGQDGKEHLDATTRFTNIWSKKSGTWKLVRVISYDHR